MVTRHRNLTDKTRPFPDTGDHRGSTAPADGLAQPGTQDEEPSPAERTPDSLRDTVQCPATGDYLNDHAMIGYETATDGVARRPFL